MNCKNCENTIQTDYSFCPDCGAKIIRNRLTIKNLFRDITERYFNLDNKFLNTFLHLFTKPEKVIESYITGVRKKYVNPISYFAIALTLAGVLIFFMRNVFDIEIDAKLYQSQGMSPELSKKMVNITYDYSSLFFIMFIPMLVLSGIITLNKNKYILAEYTTLIIYTLAQWSITSFFASFLIIIIFPDSYLNFNFAVSALMFVYIIYVLQRLNKYSAFKLIYKSLLFSSLLFFCFIMLTAVLIAIGFATSFFNLADFPQPE